jgi:hypothetical protein
MSGHAAGGRGIVEQTISCRFLTAISWGMISTFPQLIAISFVSSVWFLRFVSLNQINQTNETGPDHPDEPNREGAAALSLAEPGLPWR